MDPFSFWRVFGQESKNQTKTETLNLVRQIEELAIDVSKIIILPHFGCVFETSKKDGSLLTEIDIQSHTELTKKLIKIIDLPVLSEELSASEQQAILNAESPSYWCIDPIDGTSNFVAGIPYWCVSIALIVDGQIELGVVYDVNRDECFEVATLNRTHRLQYPEKK